jgi:hypothetical protein
METHPMLQRIHRILGLAACVVALATTLTPAHAARQTVLTAHASAEPFVWVWVDGTDLQTRTDPDVKTRIEEYLANTDWTFDEDLTDPEQPFRLLSIVKEGRTFMEVGYISDDERMFFLMHGRTSNNIVIDGMILRNPTNPSQGHAQLMVMEIGVDGGLRTSRIQTALTFK